MSGLKKVLVTGGAGYIGAHTIVELINSGYEPVALDNLLSSDLTLITGIEKITGKKANFHLGDCRNKKFLTDLFRKEGPIHSVMHFAALKSVGESVQKPLAYHENNIGSLLTLLQVMQEQGAKDLIFSSSCTVYGQPDTIPVDEQAPFKKAESPYGLTKQLCEHILEGVHKTGFRIISLRYFNPIGAHPSAHIGELPIGVPNNLVPFITQTAAGWRDQLIVFGNDYATADGSCIRDFIHVVDLAEAHVKSLAYLNATGTAQLYEAFNVGTGSGVSVLQLVNAFIKKTGARLPFRIGPRRPGDVEQVYANPAKINRVMNWKPRYSPEEALVHAWAWQQKLNR
ncbi:UDP-glucose 4-epimerase GalE [Oscillatoria amoena NRMC-F 0135]|nr:UDP-glucose 4-epimerase GalE [Oscillatoria amoena NRMC-F 0135]